LYPLTTAAGVNRRPKPIGSTPVGRGDTVWTILLGLDISMDETPAALEGIELFHEWSDNSADRFGSVDPARERFIHFE
jgi:hypothetical protein